MKTCIAIALLALFAAGCSKDEDKGGGAASASAASSAPPPASATQAAAAPSAAASASAAPLVNRADCPKGSVGPGTFDKPCEAKGATTRMMDVAWTGKYDDKGAPQFKVTNKASQTILYGRIVVYFYDKSGKQLDVKDAEGKTKPYQPCGGNIFSGVMKAGEKATISFSCVKKEHVPDGTAAIEAEMQTVGFADASGDKSDLYWRNNDLAPEQRKKGGAK